MNILTVLWRDHPVALTALISLSLIIGAHGFEAYGYAPCKLCYWQRWPHYGAVAVGITALLMRRTANMWLLLLAASLLELSGWIGFFHAGVEYGYWPGPETCSGMPSTAGSPEDFLARIQNAEVVRCDAASWSLFGVSMAGYNFIISMTGACLMGWRAYMMHRDQKAQP